MSQIVLQTMITNLLSTPKKVTWVKGGVEIPPGEGRIVEGAYPTACHNAQSLKMLEEDVKNGRVRLTIITNLEVSRPTGKPGAHPNPAAIQKQLDQGDLSTRQTRTADQNMKSSEDKPAPKKGEKSPAARQNGKQGPAGIDRKLQSGDETQQEIQAKDAKERESLVMSKGGIDDMKPASVSFDGSHEDPLMDGPPPDRTKTMFGDGAAHAEDSEKEAGDVEITPSAKELIEESDLSEEEVAEIIASRSGKKVTKLDVQRYLKTKN